MHNGQSIIHNYKSLVEKKLDSLSAPRSPKYVYEPVRYAMSSGGKRLRAIFVMLSCEAVGGNARTALDAAVAIELLHNFTLVHDDVMDNSDIRRGKPTVRKKWNTDVAILAGDQMVAQAYEALLKAKTPRLQEVLNVFTRAFNDVCEGQGLDKEYERQRRVTVNDYLKMIGKKTARMISAATEIGALIGDGTKREVAALRTFGEELGIAFQMKDDVLDISGDEQEFGKAIGGDIMEGKKTYLLLKALERTNGRDKKLLRQVIARNGITKATVNRTLEIYRRNGILDEARQAIAQRTRKAQQALASLKPNRAISALLWLSHELLERNS